MFYLNDCGYCAKARRALEELYAEKPEYREIPIHMIEESREPELADQYDDVEIEVVAGVTAANSGAAVLGAPLGHDFCLISLSDLLTPWELIEKRLHCASEADFAICIYNPRSKKRADYLQKACNIIMEHKSPDTICGWVKNIGREGQEYNIVKLAELENEPVDMFTTVFIGSASTKIIAGRMVTPRGYEKHEDSYFRGNI